MNLNELPFLSPNSLTLPTDNDFARLATSVSADTEKLISSDSGDEKVTLKKKRTFVCDFCEKSYEYRKNLNRHISATHSSAFNVQRTVPTYQHKCGSCHRQFSQLKHLTHHERKEHATPPTTCKPLKECPICKNYFPKSVIYDHFQATHDIIIDVEEIEFQSFQEFSIWKAGIEKTSAAQFRTERGSRATNTEKKHFFICHRSGHYQSKSQGLRHLKTQGSNKINGFCPASIKVTETEDGKCFVSFTKTHIGHSNDLGHLFLSYSERNNLAQKIASKIPLDEILDEVRNSVSGSGLERLHLLTKKDLYNIEKSFHLNSDVVRHKNDGTSIEAWVTEVNSSNNPCVLFYKAQGTILQEHPQLKEEDFVLIIMNEAQCEILKKFSPDCVCIDGTYGLNSYNFELITLLVIDDMRQGFPCAFLISNRSDFDMLAIFFSVVKEKAGKLSPNVFMSDMAESFYNAWLEVMNIPSKRLFCTWHVDQAWRKNLKKITNTEKQVETYKMLRTVLEERDPCAFNVQINEAIHRLSADPCTMEFSKYFKENYLGRVSLWAYCFRLHCGLNTNMHIERMHKALKYLYLKGKNVKRLDKAIHAIMKLVKDKLFDRLIIIHKGKITSKVQDLRKRHKASLLLSENIVIEIENGWNVASTKSNELYFVEHSQINCPCQLICTDCAACLHEYSCTCIDSSIKWNMCKHIHLVCRIKNKNIAVCSTETVTDGGDLQICERNVDNESEMLVTELAKNNNTEASCSLPIHEWQEKLIGNWADLIRSAKSIEEMQALQKMYTSAKPTLAAIQKCSSTSNNPIAASQTTTNVPANKNILPQRRLFSTKKRKKTNSKSLTKPTVQEAENIAISLMFRESDDDFR